MEVYEEFSDFDTEQSYDPCRIQNELLIQFWNTVSDGPLLTVKISYEAYKRMRLATHMMYGEHNDVFDQYDPNKGVSL